MTSKFKSSNTSQFRASGNLITGWTTIPNNIMNDVPNIGSDAFAVFAKILQFISNPDHKINVQGLSTQTGLTTGRVSKGLNRLIDLGYIQRNTIKDGNLTRGYEYIVYDSPQVREHIGNTRSIENRDSDISDSEFRDANKENRNKENRNKENKVVDVVTEQVMNLYKSFKLEKRVMPHTTKLLKEYINKIDLDVFEQIFIDASSDSVTNKYKYIKTILESLDKKGIKTLVEYENDNKKFKESKTNTRSKGSSTYKSKTKVNFTQKIDKMTEEEIMNNINASQKAKFGKDNVDPRQRMYDMYMTHGADELSMISVENAKAYALENNLPFE